MRKQIMIFDLNALPAPTVPPVSWAEARADYKRGPVLGSPSEAAEYFRKYIGGRAEEAFLCMYLDNRNHLLDVVLEGEGTVDQAAVYPRKMLARALKLHAMGLIMAHNHPGGSLTPSEGDKALTRQVATVARALGMSVHDHLIVTHEGHFSFRQAGLLS